MARPPPRFIITITKDQWIALMTKTRSNAEMILDSIEKTIGTPSNPIHPGANVYGKFMNFVLMTHAVEEYGKVLYLKDITPNSNGDYDIEYDYDKKGKTSKGLFKNHNHKFDLAIADLNELAIVHEGSFSDDFDSKSFDTDTAADWDSRLNIMNTDIDQDGNPIDITSTIDLDTLRQSVFDFKTKLLTFVIPK